MINKDEDWPSLKRKVPIDEDALMCPVCLSFPTSRIMQCHNGHIVCFQCTWGLDQICPVCRHKGPFARCLLGEKALGEIAIECEFCSANITYPTRDKHLKSCLERPFECPECEEIICHSQFESHAQYHVTNTGKIAIDWDTFKKKPSAAKLMFARFGRRIAIIDALHYFEHEQTLFIRVTPLSLNNPPKFFSITTKVRGNTRELRSFHKTNLSKWESSEDNDGDIGDRQFATADSIVALIESRHNQKASVILDITIEIA
jgi:hypothetical protein